MKSIGSDLIYDFSILILHLAKLKGVHYITLNILRFAFTPIQRARAARANGNGLQLAPAAPANGNGLQLARAAPATCVLLEMSDDNMGKLSLGKSSRDEYVHNPWCGGQTADLFPHIFIPSASAVAANASGNLVVASDTNSVDAGQCSSVDTGPPIEDPAMGDGHQDEPDAVDRPPEYSSKYAESNRYCI